MSNQKRFWATGWGWGGEVVEIGHFDKDFVKTSKTPEKEAPQGNILEFFLLDTLKTEWEI